MLDNQAIKYYRNIETPDNLLYNYQSRKPKTNWELIEISVGMIINSAQEPILIS